METQFFTERSNGERVVDFCRFELPHSSPDAELTSIGLSPFDMTKVRAAPEVKADRVGAYGGVSFNRNIGDSLLEERHRSHCTLPLDSNTAKSMLERIEELLHTIEIEEELLRRDFVHNNKGNEQSEKEISAKDEEDKMSPSFLHEFWPEDAAPPPSVPVEGQDRIAEYVGKKFRQVDTQLLHSMIAKFAETIVDSVIKDVANELEDVISESFREVVQIF